MISPKFSQIRTGIIAKLVVILITTGAVSTFNCTVLAEPGQERWRSVSGLGGGQINTLALIGTRIFAGTRSGVYISEDDGKTWVQSNDGITDTYIRCIAVSGGHIFVGTLNNGVFRSADGGRNWEKRNNGLDVPGASESISALIVRDNSIFAGSGFGWIFVSDDLGETWRPVVEGLSKDPNYPEFYSDVEAMAVSGEYVFVATNNRGIYRLGRNETRWVAVNSGLPTQGISTIAAIGGTLLAGTYNSRGTFYSTDLGLNWKKSEIATVRSALSFVALGDRIYGAFGHIAQSMDGGRSWQQVYEDFGAQEMLAVGQTLIAGTFFDGLFRSDDRGASWAGSNEGMTGASVMTLARSETMLLAGFEGSSVHKSDDGGVSWKSIQNNLPQPRYSSYSTTLVIAGETIFAGPRGEGVFRSTDEGRNWTPVNNGWPRASGSTKYLDAMAFLAHENRIYAAVYNGGIYVTSDSGESWQAHNQGLTDLKVHSLTVSGDAIFTGTGAFGSSGSIFRSLDKGQSWTLVNNGLNNRAVLSFAISGTTIYAGTEKSGLYISNNQGDTWVKATNGLRNHEIRGLAVIGTRVFAGTYGQGVFVSSDHGASWQAINDGFNRSDININSLIVHKNNLYAATLFHGLFVLEEAGVSCQVELEKSNFIFGSAGGVTNAEIKAASGCPWNVTDIPAWLDFTMMAGNGDMLLSINVAANYDTRARIGAININGKLLKVYQEGTIKLTAVSSASFNGASLARGSLVSAFGVNLANNTQVATSMPLPVSLGGNRVIILDHAGTEHPAELFFVSPDQINFRIPDEIATGPAIITALSADGRQITGVSMIENVSPSIFSASATGRGVASAVVLRVKPDGSRVYEPVYRYESAQNGFLPLQIDLGPAGEDVYLSLFGTGFRYIGSISELSVTIGGEAVQPLYAGPQGSLSGLDQVNIYLPRKLSGIGEAEIVITVAGRSSNPVSIGIR